MRGVWCRGWRRVEAELVGGGGGGARRRYARWRRGASAVTSHVARKRKKRRPVTKKEAQNKVCHLGSIERLPLRRYSNKVLA